MMRRDQERKDTMFSKWRLIPRLSYVNYAKEYPQSQCWKTWFYIHRFWGGRIINIGILSRALVLDFRRDWLADMLGQ